MRKTQMLVNKPAFIGLSILGLSKTVIYEFWYHCVEPRYGENRTFCYMNTDSSIVYVKKTDGIYIYIKEDVETRFDTSNFELNRPLSIGKNEKLNGLMKDELGGPIMKEFVGVSLFD